MCFEKAVWLSFWYTKQFNKTANTGLVTKVSITEQCKEKNCDGKLFAGNTNQGGLSAEDHNAYGHIFFKLIFVKLITHVY